MISYSIYLSFSDLFHLAQYLPRPSMLLQMARACPFTSEWKDIVGFPGSEKGGRSDRFPLLGLPNHCRWWLPPEVRRQLLLGRKAMTNLDSVLRSKDITLLAKVHIVKAMVFPMVINSCESWTVKQAEHQRTDAFKLWCWRRLLKVPWTARRSN